MRPIDLTTKRVISKMEASLPKIKGGKIARITSLPNYKRGAYSFVKNRLSVFRFVLLTTLSILLISCSPSPSSTPTSAITSNSGANSGPAITLTNKVRVSTSNSGFVFKNFSTQWVWVSYALLDCKRVDSVYGCNSGKWSNTISLGPSQYSTSKRSCALMETIQATISNDPIYDTYSYTVQWVAYIDPNGTNSFTPTSYPQYGNNVGSKIHVIEGAGTDHGADECI